MIEKTGIFESTVYDPCMNLAMEEWLFLHVPAGEIWLYLWQNEHTVVVGKNQNAFAECDLRRLKEDGGHLVRRLSGGGAVYHDLGNLNFTFLVHRADYDVPRQMQVLVRALDQFGIRGEVSGRNDLTVGGAKCSGNAFYKSGDRCYHHGTLLVSCDREAMARYLTPDKKKLSAKGVASVKSRVTDLQDISPEVTVPALKEALKKAFGETYGEPAGIRGPETGELEALAERYASEAWTLRPPEHFHFRSGVMRLPEGLFELGLSEREGRVRQAVLYTDALDESLGIRTEEALKGCAFEEEALKKALQAAGLNDLLPLLSSFSRGTND